MAGGLYSWKSGSSCRGHASQRSISARAYSRMTQSRPRARIGGGRRRRRSMGSLRSIEDPEALEIGFEDAGRAAEAARLKLAAHRLADRVAMLGGKRQESRTGSAETGAQRAGLPGGTQRLHHAGD